MWARCARCHGGSWWCRIAGRPRRVSATARAAGRLSGIEHMIAFFPFSVCVALVLVGIGLGFAGSFVSLRRFGDSRT